MSIDTEWEVVDGQDSIVDLFETEDQARAAALKLNQGAGSYAHRAQPVGGHLDSLNPSR